MALKSINLPTGSVKYWSKQHHRTNKQWPDLGRLKAIRCINTCQLQPNWRGYLQLHGEMLTKGMYKTDHNHHIDAFCVLLTTALLWIPQHITWKHHRGTQVFSKTKSFLLMTDSKSGQTHNQYRIKQPITNLYTSPTSPEVHNNRNKSTGSKFIIQNRCQTHNACHWSLLCSVRRRIFHGIHDSWTTWTSCLLMDYFRKYIARHHHSVHTAAYIEKNPIIGILYQGQRKRS